MTINEVHYIWSGKSAAFNVDRQNNGTIQKVIIIGQRTAIEN